MISVIDDDDSVREALTGLVRSIGYETRSFSTAEEFLASGELSNFVCLITDIQLPGMSGIELQQRLATTHSTLPVILITARDDPRLEEKARSSGAAFFFRKPIDFGKLIKSLRLLSDG